MYEEEDSDSESEIEINKENLRLPKHIDIGSNGKV